MDPCHVAQAEYIHNRKILVLFSDPFLLFKNSLPGCEFQESQS